MECLHPTHTGKLLTGQLNTCIPCVPGAIIELLNYYDISFQNSHVTIIGRL
ncbi:hypothetical protein M832_02590 [Chlamydia avium 10DC88]|uniref:Uncharacterized protein n=1 Tax=Chlamydia avium 10DC88 TaxID=1229831 RepID=W8JLF1_9CHLA|nr:hypothetical protein M832_02590 [Chlamydia avium 10DC88]